MPDYTSHSDTLEALVNAQDADSDMRDAAREAHHFVDKRDGQWEPYWWDQNEGKPRYTFDMVGPQIDQVAGDIEEADFNVTVKPAGGNATKDDAKVLDGLVRNIEHISSASDTFDLAGRNMVTAGIDGWRLEHKYVDDDSFHQDLVISGVANWTDSVWFGPFHKPDASDAPYGFLLEAVAKEEYDERWPEGSGQSVSENRIANAYYNRKDVVITGQFYYVKKVPRTLLLMSSGEVYEDTPENLQILDDMAAQGVTITDTRKTDKHVVYSRLFDGSDWLGEAKKTVFSTVPLVPVFGNFKVSEDNKIIYYGKVEKQYDAQRVFNYAKSREIEEGALAPREKLWMSVKQSAGHEKTLATLNTNVDPVQFFNPDPELPGIPGKTNGATINPGLNTLSTDMAGIIRMTAGQNDAGMGDSPNAQSGVAIKRLQDRGDKGSIKYFRAMERAIARTGRMLVDAIPAIYDTTRQVRILKEDGSFDQTTLNEQVQDQQTGVWHTVNDVSKGKYDVTCSAGPAFQNRQEETVAAITEMGAVDPSIIELAGDVLFNNVTSPGMDLVAERKRKQIFEAGMIPDDQLTEDEQAIKQQQAQEPPPEDPMMVAARAEASKAEADQQMVMVKMEALKREQDRKDWEAEQKAAAQRFDQMMKLQTGVIEQVNKQASTLKLISEALGVESLQTPSAVLALNEQTRGVIDAQTEVQ